MTDHTTPSLATVPGSDSWEAQYPYRDVDGTLLYVIARHRARRGAKRFHALHHDGQIWRSGLDGVRRIPYRLDELVNSDSSSPIYIVEGEKDADRLCSLGFIATTCPFGAGKWRCLAAECLEHFRNRSIVIVPDNDKAGRNHADDVLQTLLPLAREVRVVILPGLAEHEDVSDYLDHGATEQDLRSLVENSAPINSVTGSCDDVQGGTPEGCDIVPAHDHQSDAHGGRRSAATVAAGLVQDLEFFHTPSEAAYVTIRSDDRTEHLPLCSATFSRFLRHTYFEHSGRALNSNSLRDAIGLLEAIAHHEGGEHDVYVRYASLDGSVFIDLCDDCRRVVCITADGWTVGADAPVRFYGPRTARPLPVPTPGGSIDSLRRFVNVLAEQEWVLIVGYILGCFMPDGPYPLLVLSGEQGSAKSTTARIIGRLVDPSSVPLRAAPSSERDLMVSTQSARLLAFDNLSRIPSWLSDALCRLSTGGGFATRKLYTDLDEISLSAMRPVVLNGIDDLLRRGDLIERSIRIPCPTIPPERRLSEKSLWSRFDESLPGILGAVFDAVSSALRDRSSVSRQLSLVPRMADWAVWVTAAEPGLGWEQGSIIEAYREMLADSSELAIDASPIGPAMLTLLDRCDGEWQGTAGALLQALRIAFREESDAPVPPDWPKDSTRLSGELRRIAPNLRAAGFDVGFSRAADRSRTRQIHIRRMAVSSVRSVQPDYAAQDLQGITHCLDTADAADAGISNSALRHNRHRPVMQRRRPNGVPCVTLENGQYKSPRDAVCIDPNHLPSFARLHELLSRFEITEAD